MQPLSLKQIIAFAACPRQHSAKWFFNLPDPKNVYAQEGIDFHAACEAWLKTKRFDFNRRNRSPEGVWSSEAVAVPPESHLGKLASAAVAFAPQGALPELNQAFDLFGRTVECHIDCLWPDWSEFADWKSSGGYRELTDATLHDDMQANFQAYGMMVGSGQESIKGLWLYVDKRTYKPRPARGLFKRSECEAFLREKALPVIELIELFAGLSAKGALPELAAVPHDITACGGTGRFCNFLGHCRMQPSRIVTLAQLRAHQPQRKP